MSKVLKALIKNRDKNIATVKEWSIEDTLMMMETYERALEYSETLYGPSILIEKIEQLKTARPELFLK